jgi:coenzyme F420-reducing hydrogenase gamma subunit
MECMENGGEKEERFKRFMRVRNSREVVSWGKCAHSGCLFSQE